MPQSSWHRSWQAVVSRHRTRRGRSHRPASTVQPHQLIQFMRSTPPACRHGDLLRLAAPRRNSCHGSRSQAVARAVCQALRQVAEERFQRRSGHRRGGHLAHHAVCSASQRRADGCSGPASSARAHAATTAGADEPDSRAYFSIGASRSLRASTLCAPCSRPARPRRCRAHSDDARRWQSPGGRRGRRQRPPLKSSSFEFRAWLAPARVAVACKQFREWAHCLRPRWSGVGNASAFRRSRDLSAWLQNCPPPAFDRRRAAPDGNYQTRQQLPASLA